MSKDSFRSEESAQSSGESFGQAVKEAGDKAITNNTLVERADHASYIRHLARAGDPLTNWNAQRLWLKHCLSARTEFLFLLMSTNEERVDREDDVNEVLGKGFLDSGNLAECTKPHLRKLIADWFLRRYNWKDAYSVHYSVPPGRARGCYFAGSAIVIILLIVLSVALASGYFARLSCSSVWLQPLLLAGVIVVIVGICILLLTGRHRFLFVRLLATILVGFVPAATGGSLWKLAVEMDWPTLAAVSSATFVAGLVYCAADCARVTSLGKWRALWRALPVTLWGVLFAFVMAIVVSCVVGASMVDSAGAVPAVFYPSLLGTVYPAAVFLFAPVSLFIGLFMNSFWQEKPVTDRF